METRAWRLTLLALVLGAVLAGAPSSPSWAHQGNLVQLYVDHLEARPEGASTWRLLVRLVDVDSGRAAPGFRVTAVGTGPAQGSFGPIDLTDKTNVGEYTGLVDAAIGPWSVTVRAEEVPGGDPAVPLAKTVTLQFVSSEPHQAAAPSPGAPAGVGPSGEGPRFAVRLERGSETGSQENYVSVRATVTSRATGTGVTEGLEVYVTGTSPDGEKTNGFKLSPADYARDGIWGGFVIVPHGGHWTFTASVNRLRPEGDRRPPETFAQAAFEADITAPTLESGRPGGATTNQRLVEANPLEVGVLWIHTLVAIGWILLLLLLALVGHPAGRRLLSERGTRVLDSRVDVAIRAVGWLTAAVVLTGIYNIAKSTPYRAPLSLERMREVFRLPYSRVYYLTLGVKLATYAVMIAAAVPIVVRARRASRTLSPGRARPTAAPLPRRSPWEVRAPISVGARATELSRGLRVGAPPPLPPAPDARPTVGHFSQDETRGGRLVVLVLGAGAVLVTLAVTLLKYFHLLIETARVR